MLFNKFLCVIILLFGLVPGSIAGEYQLMTYDINSEVSFSPWGGIGLGDVIDRHKLTVITAASENSNIIVLRWNKSGNNFVAESYEFEGSDDYSTTWTMKDKKKYLSYQHKRFYMIQYKISGEKGGLVTEIFKLPEVEK